jgi:hypothetical protein
LKTTRYFDEQVLRKRPYIQREWCLDVLTARSGARSKWMAAFASGAKLRYLNIDRDICAL